jgi:BNR/Asp-box repeat protein
MRKGIGIATVFAVVAGLMALAAGTAWASTTPRWVKHVENYSGGISNGVRAYLDEGVTSAKPGLGPSSTQAIPMAPLMNVQVNSLDSNPKVPQNETQVVVKPGNPKIAVAAANDYVNGGSQIYTTRNGGQTWSTQFRSSATKETGDFCGGGGDPALAYSKRDKAFYFAQLCFFRNFLPSEVEVIRSTDNGKTWSPSLRGAYPVSNFSKKLGDYNSARFYDKEQIAVDNNPSSSFYGRIYVTYIKFHMQPNGFSDYCPVQAAYTDNIDPNGNGQLGDSHWKHTQVVPNDPGAPGVGPSANQGAQPVVDNQGGVDISYMTEECNTSLDHGIFFRRSTNGGASFSKAQKINKKGQWKDNPDPDDVLPPKNARIAASTSAPLVFDPVDNSLNYIVQNNINRATSGADISFTKSLDYGKTWSDMTTVSVNGSGQPAPEDQFFPWMDVDSEGNLHAIWFDNRNDPGNLLIQTFQGDSTDGGTTWNNHNISTQNWNPNLGFFSSGSFIGDYNGFAIGGGYAYPVWTDGRNTPGPPNGQTDIWTNVEAP